MRMSFLPDHYCSMYEYKICGYPMTRTPAECRELATDWHVSRAEEGRPKVDRTGGWKLLPVLSNIDRSLSPVLEIVDKFLTVLLGNLLFQFPRDRPNAQHAGHSRKILLQSCR